MSDGTKIGNYLIFADEKHKIGMGATGIVYSGVDTSSPKLPTVAAKKVTIEKEFLKDYDFEKEADLLLHKIPVHANVIKAHEFEKTEYVREYTDMIDFWLVMEFCEQGNLMTFARKRELSIHEKLDLIFQMALAVDHLHNCKPESVAHRDIKPQNVLLTGNEESPTVKLADFGAAKLVKRNKDGLSVALVSLAGTDHYMAPEQFDVNEYGESRYSKKIDIFSLAVTWTALLEACKGSTMMGPTGNYNRLSPSLSPPPSSPSLFLFLFYKPMLRYWNHP